ncbi:MAG TPA: alpha/beta hydrolase [Burkholderiales bacterium]|nr:alpha/beta hydrolase [Burkholderiales bacterium]
MPERSGGVLVPGGGRSLEELKLEVQRRAEHGMPPLAGISAEDARAALSQIDSLDRERWALAWSGVGERHFRRAQSLERSDSAGARDAYWNAWRVFQFARWPTENTLARQDAQKRALAAFRKYAELLAPPMESVCIPYGEKTIVGYLRLPAALRPAPLVFSIAGLDSRKEDIAANTEAYIKRDIGIFAVDLPGTGESPVAAATPYSDRMLTAALDYFAARPDVNAKRMIVQGRSWSGYWAAKLAVTERERLRGAIAHGAPIHHYFQAEWLAPSMTTGEYLYDYLEAKCAMHGAKDLEDLLERARGYSLFDAGLLVKPSAPMLVVNGARDSQVPIGDALLLLERGSAKDAWINPQGGHMGRSPEWSSTRIAEKVLLPWIARRLNENAD